MLGPEYPQIEKALPKDHARAVGALLVLDEAKGLGMVTDAPRLLDFGCGTGGELDAIRTALPDVHYTGVDIESSPEVDERTRDDAVFETFDGINLPFEGDTFDIVYSKQVFEHVRHPDDAVRDIFRVLKPGGFFVGSLSNLEPYHSFSIFNYTPYGVFRLLDDNGFDLKAMRPGPEGIGMIVRQLSNRKVRGFRLAYPMISLVAKLRRWDVQRQNYLKLRLSGHIAFIAMKPVEA